MKKLFSFLFISLFLFSNLSLSQTNPTPQSIPYSQDFSSLTGTSPVYPAGWQGWTVSGSLGTSFSTSAPNGNQTIAVITNASTSGHVGDFIGKIGMMSTSSAIKSVVLAINTTGLTNIQLVFDAMTQRTENTRQNELGLQYRIGTSGTFTNITSGQYQNQMSPTNTTGTTSVNIVNKSVTLPAACENQAVVQIRWIIRDVSGSGNRPGFGLDNISVTGSSAVTPTVNITAPTISSGNVDQGAVNCILMRYDMAVTNSNAILNGLTITTGGSYTDQDITNFKVRYSNDVVLDAGDATLSTYINSSTAGTIIFPTFTSQSITMNTTGYIFVTADISSTATEGNNVNVLSTPFSNISFSGTVNKTGTDPIAEGGLQSFQTVIPNVTISSTNPAVNAGNITQNTSNNVIYLFSLYTDKANATLTGLKINTAGTYNSGDLTNLKAWYSADNTFSSTGDILLSTIAAVNGPGEKIFTEWTNQVLTNGSTGYIFITADVPCSGVFNNLVYVSAVTVSDLTLANGDLGGTTYASSPQTIQYAAPSNPFVNTISSSTAGTLTLSWSNPGGCFDEIMIVASTSTITDVPSGNGSAYTANLIYGNGTPFGSGFVVYKGITSPETVTGLTEGNTYYFKFFTRNGTAWSTGYEKSSFLAAPISQGDIYISHLSADYNGSSDEFVVLFNNSSNSIDLNGYELRYFAATGNSGSALCSFNTSTVIQSKKHLLLSPNATITVGSVTAKARDIAMTSGLATNGQLVLRQTADTSIKVFALAWGTITGYVSGMTDAAPWSGDGMISLAPNGTTYTYSGGLDYTFSNSAYSHTLSANIFNIPNNSDGTLPVNLTSLNSVITGRDVTISWSTESELNNLGFDIERKSNSDSWSKIGFIKGTGNSNTTVDYNFRDTKLNSGNYEYRLKQIDNNGNYKYYNLENTVVIGIPKKFSLSQNYPNPFNPVTKIDFELPSDSKVRMIVYDVLGREVKTLLAGELKKAGYYTVEFNAGNIASGTYFCRMLINSNNQEYNFIKRMVLIK